MKKALRYAGAMLGFVVFLLLVLIGIGTTLPINHTAACATEIKAPVGVVWKFVADPSNYTWRSDIASFKALPPPSHTIERWAETDRNGQTITYELVSQEYGRHIVRRIADPTLPFGGMWTLQFSPAAHGTRLSIVENGQIYNPVFRLMARYFIGYTSTMRTYLTDLGLHFGAAPQVDCAVPAPAAL
jgi:hypothetical protein